MSEEILSLYGHVLVTVLEKWNNFPRVYSQTCSAAMKGTVMQIKKHWQMIAYMFQNYPKSFPFKLFIILL